MDRVNTIIKEDTATQKDWDMFLKPFSAEVWLSILTLIIVCSVLLTITTNYLSERSDLMDNVMFPVYAFCNQGML